MKSVSVLLICGIVLCMCVVFLVPQSPRIESQPATTNHSNPQAAPPKPSRFDSAVAPPSDITELKISDVVEGDGAEAVAGKRLSVHYTGWLYDTSKEDRKGKQFDSSVNRAVFAFNLGRGEVIQGWDVGMQGMKVGGKRILLVPPTAGYGPVGSPPDIPGNATLMFEVELKGVD